MELIMVQIAALVFSDFVVWFLCIIGGWILGYGTCNAMIKGSNYDDNHELIFEFEKLLAEKEDLIIKNNELSAKNVKLHVELDALKAHNFPAAGDKDKR
jgi:hypothetical protein